MYSGKIIAERVAAIERATKTSLRRYTLPEVDAFLGDLAAAEKNLLEGEREIANLPQHLQAFITNEQRLCMVDFRYWAERYAYLVSDRTRVVRFDPWPSQTHFLDIIAKEEEKKYDLWKSLKLKDEGFRFKGAFIWVKARQVGGTRLAEILLAHLTFLRRNVYTLVASDTPEKGLELWRLMDKLYDNLPWWMAPKRDGRTKGDEHYFQGINSTIVVGSGNQKASLGQGVTVHNFHVTEVSTWLPEVADMIDSDLFHAFDSSASDYALGLIESTAKGGGGNWFGREWDVCTKGKGFYTPVFLSWFHCPDKKKDNDPTIVIRPETESLAKRIEERFPNIHLVKNQLAWYQLRRDQAEAKNELGKFLQETPSFPEEAFEYGVQSVFSIHTREKVKQDCRMPILAMKWEGDKPVDAEWDGDPDHADDLILIWEPPEQGRTYYIAVDGAYGTEGGDSHSVQVVAAPLPIAGLRTEQVARWTSKGKGQGATSLALVTKIAVYLGMFYKAQISGRPACIAPESNPGSPSGFVTLKLVEQGYPNIYLHRRAAKIRGQQMTENLGWQTNEQTRGPLVLRGMEDITSGQLIVRASTTLAEMRTFEKKYSDSGRTKFEHADGKHDDELMALFIANYIATDEYALRDTEEEARGSRLQDAKIKETFDKEQNKWLIMLGVESPEEPMMRLPDGMEMPPTYGGDDWLNAPR